MAQSKSEGRRSAGAIFRWTQFVVFVAGAGLGGCSAHRNGIEAREFGLAAAGVAADGLVFSVWDPQTLGDFLRNDNCIVIDYPIKVKEPQQVSSLTKRVDIVLTVSETQGGASPPMSGIILQNIQLTKKAWPNAISTGERYVPAILATRRQWTLLVEASRHGVLSLRPPPFNRDATSRNRALVYPGELPPSIARKPFKWTQDQWVCSLHVSR